MGEEKALGVGKGEFMTDKGKGFRRNARDIVYEFIASEIAASRPFPSRQKVADHMGWKNTSGSQEVLHQLAHRGLLRRRMIDWPGSSGRRWVFALGDAEESTERKQRVPA